jgi:predicted phage terminase large subunit-like protein
MPRPGQINPKTGKRVEWEAEQEAKKAAQPEIAELEQRLSLLKRAQAAQNARTKFMPFIKFTSPDPEDPNDVEKSKYKNAKHHDAIARVVEEVVEGNIRFLILTMPPRHGKSEQVSRRLPAWFIGKFPHQNGVVATYNDDFAQDFGREVRSIIKTPQFKQVFPASRLQRGGEASDLLKTVEGGQWSFVGRGGSLTGRGAHLLIIDDLIKDDKEAQSQAIRDQAWSWFTKVAMSRRMGMKLVIMTFTRWHADDPIGRLTDPENQHYNENLAKKIKIINLPAIAEEDDPLGRDIGEPLWPDGPDKFDLEFLEEQRSLDPLGFEALYQQHPSLLDGDQFKREPIKYYGPGTGRDLPDDLRIYAASDHAVSTAQRRDPTVLLKIGVDRNDDIYLLECIWKKMPSDEAVEAMLAMMKSNMKPVFWWAERGHISKSIGPFLKKRMLETKTYINVVEVTPSADKPTRAQSISARSNMGKVYFPKGEWWTEKAINEMMAFPNGPHDDFVDALAYIGLGLQNQFGPSKKSVKDEPAKFGTLAWVKSQDSWRERKLAEAAAGGF